MDLEKALDLLSKRSHELIALDDALCALAEVDPRTARIVELRFFGGLEVRETAEAIGIFSRNRVARLEVGACLVAC